MCHKKVCPKAGRPARISHLYRLGWEDWPLGPPFLPSLPWGPMFYPIPSSLSLSPAKSLLDQRVRRRIASSSTKGGWLEVESGAWLETHHSAPKPGSLGKPEQRPLQQGFFEMLRLLCIRFSVSTGTVGSRRRRGGARILCPESLRARSSGRSGVFVVGEFHWAAPAPPHPLTDLLIETPFHFCFIYLLARQ